MSMDESSESTSGKEFREKFEATMAENGVLRVKIAEQLGVEPEALKGIPADQVVDKANELKQAQKAQEEAVLRKHLGLEADDDLETALQKARGGETTVEAKKVADPFASAGQLGGAPPDQGINTEGLRGRDLIKAGIQARNKKSNS